MRERTSLFVSLARQAGEIMLSAPDIRRSVSVKPGDANFVTKYDVAVQEFLIREIGAALPDVRFFAEEQEKNILTDEPTCIIDPIDGTTNFIYGLACSCVSIGYYENALPAAGVIYNPYEDELFFAERGEGAFLTHAGETVRLSIADVDLSHTLAAVGTDPYNKSRTAGETMRVFAALFDRVLDLRRSGSATVDQTNVAAGRVGIFYENHSSPWDFAAGRLIITEAGGVVCRPDGKPLPMGAPGPILAGAPTAVRQFIEEIGYRGEE